MRVVHFNLDSMLDLSSVRLLLPKDLRAVEGRAAVAKSMKEAFRRFARRPLALAYPPFPGGVEFPAYSLLSGLVSHVQPLPDCWLKKNLAFTKGHACSVGVKACSHGATQAEMFCLLVLRPRHGH